MNLENRIWQAISIAVVIFSFAVPVYVKYDLHTRGPIPEKRVELMQIDGINPMSDLSALGEKVRLSLTVENETVDNLVISKAYLKNAGNSPIIPDDYHENISVSVPEPWKIVAVKSPGDLLNQIKLTWNKVTDTRFEAQPALLNPGDRVSTTIYLTNTKFKGLMDYNVYRDLKVKWNARITNLRRFSKMPLAFDNIRFPRGIIVLLSGWALPFTLLLAGLFLCLYLYLLFKSALLKTVSHTSIPVIAAFSLLSFGAAEVIAYYLFRQYQYSPIKYLGGGDWINFVVLIIHGTAIIYLYIRIVQHKGTYTAT